MQRYVHLLFYLFFAPLVLADQATKMHTAHVSMQQPAEYRLMAVSQQPLRAGAPVKVILTLQDREGQPVTAAMLKNVHTQILHALIIDPSLTDYHHQHPQPRHKPGQYEFIFTPVTDNNYRIWLDITPQQGAQQYVIADLHGASTDNPAVNKVLAQQTSVAGYTFGLTFDTEQLQAQHLSVGHLLVKDAAAKPVAQLEPIMGAFAHVVAFSEDYQTVLHVHPMGKQPQTGSERGGPQVDFHLMPTTTGYVKIFAQVQIKQQQIIAPLGVEVKK